MYCKLHTFTKLIVCHSHLLWCSDVTMDTVPDVLTLFRARSGLEPIPAFTAWKKKLTHIDTEPCKTNHTTGSYSHFVLSQLQTLLNFIWTCDSIWKRPVLIIWIKIFLDKIFSKVLFSFMLSPNIHMFCPSLQNMSTSIWLDEKHL